MPLAEKLRTNLLGRLSIRTLFILVLLPGVIVGLILAWSYISDRRADLERGALQTTRAIAQSIDKDLEGIANSLGVLSTSLYLRKGDFKAFHGRAVEVAEAQPLVDVIALARQDGAQIINSARPWGAPLPPSSNPELLHRTIGSGKTQYSDLYVGSVTRQPYVAVQTPVQIQGEKYGLTMAAPAERLSKLLTSLNLPQGWTCVIIDKNGKIIARSERHSDWVGKPAIPWFLEKVAAMGNEGILESPNLDGVNTLSAFRRTETSGWIVVLGVPLSVLYKDMPRSLALGGLLIGLCLGAGTLFAIRFSREVGKTVQSLESAVKLAADGSLDVTVPVDGPSEIARLARHFNEMQTARREAQAQQERIKRALLLLNESNTVLLFSEDEKALLQDVCRLIVQEGDYLMAWVGYAQPDPEKLVKPVASFGMAGEYLQAVRISWGENPLGNGPTERAIRTGSAQVNRNIQTNPAMAPWREAAIQRGYQSSTALPLVINGAVIGALTIYAAEPEAFATEEVSLLEKLASNLSFGIERLRTRNQLAIANEELRGFTYAASHDMKAPLQRISVFSGMLEKSLTGRLTDNEQTMFGFIKENATRIISLVDDLLAHAQIEQVALVTCPVSLRDAVHAILQEKETEFEEAGAVISCDLPDLQVVANSLALAQVLRNLLSNALKYSSGSNPPTIRISGHTKGSRCRLAVRDNGIGFDMAYHDKIFEIFRRLHTYAEISGNGVGLALVKKAMERMDGKVWAESAPGEGAAFFIELPVAEALEPASRRIAEPA